MSSDGGSGGIAPDAAARPRKRTAATDAPAQHDSAAAPVKRTRLQTGVREAAARAAAEAEAAARAVVAAPCDACGNAAGEEKHDTDDGRSVCAACRACADCGNAVGTTARVAGSGAQRRVVCAACVPEPAEPRAAPAEPRAASHTRMWLSDAKREFKLTDQEMVGLRVFQFYSRRHGIKQMVLRHEVAERAASPAVAAARAAAAAVRAAEAAERAAATKQRAASKRRLETLEGMANARGLSLDDDLPWDLSCAEQPPPEGDALLPLHAYVHAPIGAARQHSKAAMQAILDDAGAAKAARIERVVALRNALRRGEAAALGLSIETAALHWSKLFGRGGTQARSKLAGDPLFSFVMRGDDGDGALTRALAPAASAALARLRRVDDFVAAAAALSLVFPAAFLDAMRRAAREVGTTEDAFVQQSMPWLSSRVDLAAPARSRVRLQHLKHVVLLSAGISVTGDSAFSVPLAAFAKCVYRGGHSARLPSGLLVSMLFNDSLVRAPWAPLTADNARHVCSPRFARIVRWLSDSHTAPFNALPEPVLLRILNAASEMQALAVPAPRFGPGGAAHPGGRRGDGQHIAHECAHAGCNNLAPSKGSLCPFSMCGHCCRRHHPGACTRHR